jgi:hypothetical protein
LHIAAPDQSAAPNHARRERNNGSNQNRKKDRFQVMVSQITSEHEAAEHGIGENDEQTEGLNPESLRFKFGFGIRASF